eukprot:gnl/TRDRNA2_/TRDRNA2_168189_c2_seq1.p1 gnl/TRDRNA2_/TRDRNA2_168189_c2~~gnl/TRDRNA2_/TRDRNA2_168189_c2_seq1.p1  ORF type:complete len:241 (+),score=35.92 gnl/TRDRNA2_/TRDRNA2_168189_c2_seq1:77-724(+)
MGLKERPCDTQAIFMKPDDEDFGTFDDSASWRGPKGSGKGRGRGAEGKWTHDMWEGPPPKRAGMRQELGWSARDRRESAPPSFAMRSRGSAVPDGHMRGFPQNESAQPLPKVSRVPTVRKVIEKQRQAPAGGRVLGGMRSMAERDRRANLTPRTVRMTNGGPSMRSIGMEELDDDRYSASGLFGRGALQGKGKSKGKGKGKSKGKGKGWGKDGGW